MGVPPGLALSNWSEALADRVRARFQERSTDKSPNLPRSPSRKGGPHLRTRWTGLSSLSDGAPNWQAQARRCRFACSLCCRDAFQSGRLCLAQVFQRKPSPMDHVEDVLRTGGRSMRRMGEWARELATGRHIHAPPFAQIAERGIGLVLFCPAELAPDDAKASVPALERLSNDVRGGVLAHWAAITTAARELLGADKRFAVVPVFATHMHLDWGGLDILRERASGRIYIVDANKTDMSPLALPFLDKMRASKKLGTALEGLVAELGRKGC